MRVRAGRNFLSRYNNRDDSKSRRELFQENPGLYYAHEIYIKSADEPEYRAYIEARLLSGQSREEVADILDTIPETIDWYEAIYFNILDRLRSRDWITKQILMPAIMRSYGDNWVGVQHARNDDEIDPADPTMTKIIPWDRYRYTPAYRGSVAQPYLDGTLKLFSYFGGPLMADLMITGFQSGKPLVSPDAMGAWFDSFWTTTIRRRSHQAALTCEINRHNVMELFTLHAKIIEIERSEESQEKQRTTIETHINAFVSDLPWVFGDAGEKAVAGTPLEGFDQSDAELRDDELIQVAAGEPPKGIEHVKLLKLPPPRKKAAPVVNEGSIL